MFKTGPRPLPDSVYIDTGSLHIVSGYDTEYDVYKYNETEKSRWELIGTTTSKVIAGLSGGEYISVCPEGENIHGDCSSRYRLLTEGYSLDTEVPFSYSGNNIASVLPLTFEKAMDGSSNLRKVIEGIGKAADSLSRDMNYLYGERSGKSITWNELEHYTYTEFIEFSSVKGILDGVEYELVLCDEDITPIPSRYEFHDCVDSFFEMSGTKEGDLDFDENTRIGKIEFYVDSGNMMLVGFTEEFGNIVYVAKLLDHLGNEISGFKGFDVLENRLFVLGNDKLYFSDIPNYTNTTIYMQGIDVSGFISLGGLKMIPNGFVSYSEEMDVYKCRHDYYSYDYYEIRAFEDYDVILIDDVEVESAYSRLWTSSDDKLQLYGLFRSDYQKLAPFYVYSTRFMKANCWHDFYSFNRFINAFNINANIGNIDEYMPELSDFNLVKDMNGDVKVSDAIIGTSESGVDKFVVSSGLTDTAENRYPGITHLFYESNDHISKFLYFDGYTVRLFSDDLKEDLINNYGGYLLKKPSDHGVYPYDGEHRFIRVPVGEVDNWAIIYGDSIISGIDLTGKTASYFSGSVVEDVLESSSHTLDIDGESISCYISTLSGDFSFGLDIDETLYFTDGSVVYYSFDDSSLEMVFCFPVSCYVEYSTSDSDYLEESVSTTTMGVPDSIVVPDYNDYEYRVHIAKESASGFLYITPVVYSGDIEEGEIAICESTIEIEIDGITTVVDRIVSGKPIIIPEVPGEYYIKVHVTSGLSPDVKPSGFISFTVEEETETAYVEISIPLTFEVE
jgi:hypothetical protein